MTESGCFNKSEYLECVERVSSGTRMITSSVLNSMDNTMRDVEFLYEVLILYTRYSTQLHKQVADNSGLRVVLYFFLCVRSVKMSQVSILWIVQLLHSQSLQSNYGNLLLSANPKPLNLRANNELCKQTKEKNSNSQLLSVVIARMKNLPVPRKKIKEMGVE